MESTHTVSPSLSQIDHAHGFYLDRAVAANISYHMRASVEQYSVCTLTVIHTGDRSSFGCPFRDGVWATCLLFSQKRRRSRRSQRAKLLPHPRTPRRHTRRARTTTRCLPRTDNLPDNAELIVDLLLLESPCATRQCTIPRRRAVKRRSAGACHLRGNRVVGRGGDEGCDLGCGG